MLYMSLLLLLLDSILLQTCAWNVFCKLAYRMKVFEFRDNYGLGSQRDFEIVPSHIYHPIPHIHL